MAKKFNKWRQGASPIYKNIDNSFKKAKDINDFINRLKKALIKNLGDEFFDKLDKYRNPDRFKNRLIRLYKIKEKANKNLLKK